MMDNRDIDRLVAEKVFNWEWREREYNRRVFGDNPPTYYVWWDKAIDNVPALCLTEKTNYNTDYTPLFSTDISAAWQVVEKLEEMDFWAQLRTPFDKGAADSFYWCGFTPRLTTGWNGKPDHWTNAPTITMAICLSALKCVGVEVAP